MNIFKDARLIARHCLDKTKRERLVERCDEAKEVFDRFAISASSDDMEHLVAAWTRLLVAMDDCGPWRGGEPSGAGRLRLPATGAFDHDPDILDVIQNLTAAA